MTTSYDVLVVILSITLAVFLILGIIALAKIIQIMNGVKRLVAKAEQVADNVETMTAVLERTATGPGAVLKTVAGIINNAMRHKSHKEDDSDG
ncbi:MAG TPA: hypothetical protein VLE69_00035 [Candidatus Saccharimonadales bacterium]|nr:hypothetical protein [Candidatus Saccharimonadales bacterium]